jgi:hypothetical protein
MVLKFFADGTRLLVFFSEMLAKSQHWLSKFTPVKKHGSFIHIKQWNLGTRPSQSKALIFLMRKN